MQVYGGQDGHPVQPGSAIVIKGQGMPLSKYPNRRGDLIATIKVVFPTSISESQQSAIKKIFAA